MKLKRNLLRIGIICFITIMLFSMYLFSEATTQVYLETTTNLAQKGEEIEVIVRMRENKTVAFNGYLSFDSNKVEYISGLEMVNVQENRVLFVWYDTTGRKQAKDEEIARFRFHVKEEGIANFSIQGDFYDQTGEKIEVETIGTQLRIGEEEKSVLQQEEITKTNNTDSTNANLQTLRIDKEGMIPQFDTNVTQYYLTVGEEIKEIEVLATPQNTSAKVNVTGNTNLKEGINKVIVEVTAEDNSTKKEYSIEVSRTKDIASANTNLETLAIEGSMLEPAFDNTIVKYKTEIPKGTNFLNILAIPENEKASVSIEGKENIQEGDNLIKVIVIAPDKLTKKIVEIIVHKRNEKEETIYQQERIEEQKALEEAYKIEKTSVETEEQKKKQLEEEKQTRNSVMVWTTMGIIGIGIIILVFHKYQG